MNAELHPITRRVLASALMTNDPAGGIPLDELQIVANLVLGTPDAEVVGVEMIALAKKMAAAASNAFAEQLVVLAGLALGDAAGATVGKSVPSRAAAPAACFIPIFTSREAPEGSVRGGPLARARANASLEPAVPAAESKCPFHRAVRRMRKVVAF